MLDDLLEEELRFRRKQRMFQYKEYMDSLVEENNLDKPSPSRVGKMSGHQLMQIESINSKNSQISNIHNVYNRINS